MVFLPLMFCGFFLMENFNGSCFLQEESAVDADQEVNGTNFTHAARMVPIKVRIQIKSANHIQ